MIKVSLSYLRKNPKQTFTILFGIIFASMVLFCVGILFSSFREYLILKVTKENDFHVKIKGNLNGLYDKNIKSIKYLDSTYFIKFENIYGTYDLTDKICEEKECLEVIYNSKLLSLYGIGDNNYLDLFKELIFIIVFILAISVFFIIYNSFQISFSKKRKDIILFKAMGALNGQLYKMLLFEGLIYMVFGIFLGFGLSIFISYGIIGLINNLLSEVLGSNIGVYLYGPFIFIPLIFIILIVFLSSLLPLFILKKYKVMELFRFNRENNFFKSRFKNVILNFGLINYMRNKKKYKGLIICIFIIMFLFNFFYRLTDYTVKIMNEYVYIPSYDLKVISDMSDYSKLDGLAKNLSSSKETIYRSCSKLVHIPKENYNRGYKENMTVLVTDIGGNEVINLTDDIVSKNDKMVKVDYKIFNSLDKINISNNVIDGISLTDKIPFGFETELLEGRIILNLDKDKFDLVCPVYEGGALIKSDENNIDNKVLKYFKENNFGNVSYVNIKKVYEIMDNLVLLIKLFMYFSCFIVSLISVLTIFNIVSTNVKLRKREFASLKTFGLENFKINLCLFFESLIITGKGALYSFPFILLVSNFLYKNLGMFFEVNLKIFDIGLFVLNFIICFLLIYICMIFSHFGLYKKELIYNIKCDNV